MRIIVQCYFSVRQLYSQVGIDIHQFVEFAQLIVLFHVFQFFLCLWASLFFFVFFSSVRAFRLDETTHLESHRRFASTKHQFFENRLKHVNPLAFYAETGFHRKNMISSNPSAFYVDLGAAASTKHTILKNPKGTSKGAPRDAQGAQGTQGTPKGPLTKNPNPQGTPTDPRRRTRSPKGRFRDVQGPPRTSKGPPRNLQGSPKGSPRTQTNRQND